MFTKRHNDVIVAIVTKVVSFQDPEQMEFLRELMDLQKEMVTLLLSMLEGNVLNGPIGKQMVDTLALCSQNVQDVLQFFTTFLKYSEMVAGVAFQVRLKIELLLKIPIEEMVAEISITSGIFFKL